jgi:hypothetical protein
MVQGYTRADGAVVAAHDNGRAAAIVKTGSSAPAKTKNIGTAKYPLHAKCSAKLSGKRSDGCTHHVGGFKPPIVEKGKRSTEGDVMVHHADKTYHYTGKSGTNSKTGEAAYEFGNSDGGQDRRAWVSHSGHLQEG